MLSGRSSLKEAADCTKWIMQLLLLLSLSPSSIPPPLPPSSRIRNLCTRQATFLVVFFFFFFFFLAAALILSDSSFVAYSLVMCFAVLSFSFLSFFLSRDIYITPRLTALLLLLLLLLLLFNPFWQTVECSAVQSSAVLWWLAQKIVIMLTVHF